MVSIAWSDNLLISLQKIYPECVKVPMTVAEIGCFEGYGTKKLFNHLCNHESSKIFCIDPWDNEYVKNSTLFVNYKPEWFNNQFERFQENTKDISHKIQICRGYSKDILPILENKSFDLIYVDGDHSAKQVYIDACLSLPLVKSGGIILFDDYDWRYNGDGGPCEGIQKFVSENPEKTRIEFIERNQCAIRIA